MGHVSHPNLLGGLLVLPYLVVVWIRCFSVTSAPLSSGRSTIGFPLVVVDLVGSSPLGVLVLVSGGFRAVAFFGLPLWGATALLVSGANLAGWQFAQWYILCRSLPDASFPRSRSSTDLPLRSTIGYGPAMSGPNPFLGTLM